MLRTVLLSFFIDESCAFVQVPVVRAQDQEEGFTVAPIPIMHPVTDEGAGLALVYRYHLSPQNKTSSSSASAIGGFVTTNRSWGVGIAQKFFWKEDQWRARMAASYADVRYNFYGIGKAAGDAGVSDLTKQKGFGGLAELLYRVDGLWYAGGLYRLLDTDTTFVPNPELNLAEFVSPDEEDVRVALLGPRVTRDSRDDRDYPREGSLFDLRIGFDGDATGGQLGYSTYDISYNKFVSLGSRSVLAMRGVGCYTTGNVPFFDLCLLSTSDNVRGYRASRYRDGTMWATQGEYRWEAFKRVGFVAFAGVGELADTPRNLGFNNMLPGGGAGLRYRVTREKHINLRFDYAWGRGSHIAYFFIGEAF